MIKSKAFDELYSADALRKSDSEPLEAIHGLDLDLQRWRLSLPVRIRPTVRFMEQSVPDNIDMEMALMKISYCHCVAIIHRAYCRYRVTHPALEVKVTQIGSGMLLSAEASRTLLLYFQRVAPARDEFHRWYVQTQC